MKTHLNNVAYHVIEWVTEGTAAEAEGREVPPQYKALIEWATGLVDPRVAKQNGQPKQKAA
jgi:hypothetical protein